MCIFFKSKSDQKYFVFCGGDGVYSAPPPREARERHQQRQLVETEAKRRPPQSDISHGIVVYYLPSIHVCHVPLRRLRISRETAVRAT